MSHPGSQESSPPVAGRYSPTDVERAMLHGGDAGFVAETLATPAAAPRERESVDAVPVGGNDPAAFPVEMDADTIDFAATSHSRTNSFPIRLDADPAAPDAAIAGPAAFSPAGVDLLPGESAKIHAAAAAAILASTSAAAAAATAAATAVVSSASTTNIATTINSPISPSSYVQLGQASPTSDLMLGESTESLPELAAISPPRQLQPNRPASRATGDLSSSTFSSPLRNDLSIDLSLPTNQQQPLVQQHEEEEQAPPPPPPPPRVDRGFACLVANIYPEELHNGLHEIVLHCPHKNFLLSDSMMDQEVDPNMDIIPLAFVNNPTFIDGKSRVALVNNTDSLANYVKQYPIISEISKSMFDATTGSGKCDMFVVVEFGRKIDAFRALGRLLSTVFAATDLDDIKQRLNWEETCQFDTAGSMIDCSRCAVLSVPSVFFMLRTSALLGLVTMQLYTEDTYEVPGEPFFGYLRGKFTSKQLRAIDDYAFDLGIEIIPCIQTLGHLGQILQWPRFASMKDTHEVLLADYDETYEMIDKMITSITSSLRTKRIHIGMDEAHGVGEGRYRQIFGNADSTEVFLAHLAKVYSICKDKGLEPMVWSDMLFSLAAKDNSLQSYYGDASLPSTIRKRMPPGLTLVYWDYYHIHEDAYARKIKHHRELGYEPWVAGGIWTWNRFVTALPFTIAAATACLRASKKENVRNIFVTIWGDDGNEVDIMSALPGLVLYGEHAYTSNDDILIDVLKNKFAAVCGGRFDDFIYSSKIDMPPGPYDRTRFPPNPSKWLMWQDPFYAFLSPQAKGVDLVSYYDEIANHLELASTDISRYPLNYRLRFPALISRTLYYKINIRDKLVDAYAQPNPKEHMARVLHGPLKKLCVTLDDLWRYHRSIWLATYKPFGLEIIEMRYGAIRTRMQSMYERVYYYCYGAYPPPVGGGYASANSYNLDSGGVSNVHNHEDTIDEDLVPVKLRAEMKRNPGHPVATSTVYEGRDPLNNFNDMLNSNLPETLNCFPEFQEELNDLYGGGIEIVLEFARSYTPARALGTG